jgi:hypothetical protein
MKLWVLMPRNNIVQCFSNCGPRTNGVHGGPQKVLEENCKNCTRQRTQNTPTHVCAKTTFVGWPSAVSRRISSVLNFLFFYHYCRKYRRILTTGTKFLLFTGTHFWVWGILRRWSSTAESLRNTDFFNSLAAVRFFLHRMCPNHHYGTSTYFSAPLASPCGLFTLNKNDSEDYRQNYKWASVTETDCRLVVVMGWDFGLRIAALGLLYYPGW